MRIKRKRGDKQHEKKYEKTLPLFVRYLILLIAGVFLPVFYKIFLPLTIWPVYFLLNIFAEASVSGNILVVSGSRIEIVNSCVAGSAYYLLLILNLTTGMNIKKRIFSLIFSFLALLVLNILRVFSLSVLYTKNYYFFSIAHTLFWLALSVLFVIGVWFLTANLFKIKNIPIYSDVKLLCKKSA